ncbi:hypothetical protein LSH36_2144g00003 [Paralvinella palmiformis]|uniref:Ig-like domain-containing protein n=1 Tax=Paralvinella palmiformis TaxID=53620 RepID=A0AAD9IQU1_9ANNE|nr:hypothetical protein LSH36_2144g00003 [Paralvinella palmiformis]
MKQIYNLLLISSLDPPELNIRVTPSGDLIQGSDVTVSCIVNSRPEPSSIKWTNITDPDLQDIDCSHKNNTHCMLTLSDINILDSGTYQCQVDNGVKGSPVTLNKNIIVYGPARWYNFDTDDHVNGVSIGATTNFKVWVIARPLPRQDQWKWKFSPSNSSNVMTTDPGHVHLTVYDDMAVLSITNVTISYYGNYCIWTNNQYGGWADDKLMFILKPQGILTFLF